MSTRFAGVAWMVFAMSCIGIVDGLAKLLTQRLNGLQVVWGYFLATLVVLLAYSVARRIRPATLVRSRRPLLQAGRAAALVVSLSGLFVGFAYLPLADATAISFTAPLMIVALSGPMLGERIGPGRWAAVAAGMVGALVVVRPGSALFHWAALAPLVGAFFFSQFHIVTKVIGGADPPATTLFWTFGVGTVLASLAVPFVWAAPTTLECLLFLASGTLGFAAHLGIVRALLLADASALAPLNYVRLVWAIAIGLLVFDHVPDAATLAGGAIIVGSGLYVVYSHPDPAQTR